MPQLGEVHIPRSVKRAADIYVDEQQLHIFVDASQAAYGTVCYLQHKYRNEEAVPSQLEASKLKVAPLTALSIPCLELMAAAIGVHLTKSIQTTLGIRPRG